MSGREIRIGSVGAFAADGGVVRAVVATGQQVGGDRPADVPVEVGRRADVGILTVLGEEMRAVVGVLRAHRGYRSERLPGGPRVHEALVPAQDGGDLRVVAMRTLEPGAASASAAYRRLRDGYGPPVVLLVGIAGGIRADLAVGDVVIGDEVVCYDARRETPWAPRRRGRSHVTTAALRHRVNDFFLAHGPTVAVPPAGIVRVFRGPVGSGGAVVTDEDSDVVDYLRRFNEKTLAVETEAGGVGQAFYEEVGAGPGLAGWLTVRGISDLADRHKGHDRHQYAADRAAAVTDRLLPLLGMTDRTRLGAARLAEPA